MRTGTGKLWIKYVQSFLSDVLFPSKSYLQKLHVIYGDLLCPHIWHNLTSNKLHSICSSLSVSYTRY